MQKTLIEWVKNPDGSQGYTWNPITGCLNHDNGLCKGGGFPCYAYKLANGRLKSRYLANESIATYPNQNWFRGSHEEARRLLDPFYPRFWENRMDAAGGIMPKAYYKGGWAYQDKGIFVCDMGDLFGDSIPYEWQKAVFDTISLYPANRFYLLTKQPQNLINFSPFPENCWVGVTATNQDMFERGIYHLCQIKANILFMSFEPLLGRIKSIDIGIRELKWLIIGACTGRSPNLLKLQQQYPSLTLMPYGHQRTAQPRIEDLREIVEAADKAGIPVFLKDNLKPGLYSRALQHDPFWRIETNKEGIEILELRQEMPE